jgi:HSP20 family molecular chaperone IbpA
MQICTHPNTLATGPYGHFARAFTSSHHIDQQQISPGLSDGLLTVTLKKAREAQPRRMEIRQTLAGPPWGVRCAMGS